MSLDFYPRKGPDGQPVKVDSGFGSSQPPAHSFIAALIDADDPARWLVDTPLLQIEHPRIRLLARKLTQLQRTPREKAIACFAHLRSLPFGCIADSTGTSALSVLGAGMGDCHTKSTLLIAMLRSLEIPARLRFVTLKPDFLHGIIDTGGQPIEHAYSEVLLGDRWMAVDSYVVDPRLAVVAKARLRAEGRSLGYGMHVDGLMAWDGASNAFAQFTLDDPASMPLHDWGAFDDPYQFYSSVAYVRGRMSLSSRFKWMLGAQVVNHRVKALRQQATRPQA
jgi:transglutaminase-like putative cysteine protease